MTECFDKTLQIKRGIQQSLNDYNVSEAEKGEPVYGIDSKRLFIGYNNELTDTLTGNETTVESTHYYGSGDKETRGFQVLPVDLFVHPKEVRLSTGATNGSCFNFIDCIDCANTGAEFFFTIKYLPYWDRTKDIYASIVYSSTGGSVSTSVLLNSYIWKLNYGSTPAFHQTTGPSDPSYVDTIDIDSTNNDKTNHTQLTNFIIPSSLVESKTEKIALKFERDNSDTFTGTFQILMIHLYQLLDGTGNGYTISGVTRTSGSDTSPNITSYVNRITFPFDDGTGRLVGNTSTSRTSAFGFNSSTYGYIAGGSTEATDNPSTTTSSVDRISFPFSEGTSSNVCNLTQKRGLGAGFNSSQYGYCISGYIPENPGESAYSRDSDKIVLSFDSYTVLQTASNLDIGYFGCGGLNSSTHGYVLGGNNAFYHTDRDYTAGTFSSIHRLTFAMDNGIITTSSGTYGIDNDLPPGVPQDAERNNGTYNVATYNSSTYGYAAGGAHMQSIGKILFPFDTGTMIDVGNISASRSSCTGCNSTTHGYIIGGGHYTLNLFYSSVQRTNFASDGNATSEGNLAGSCYDLGSSCDGVDFGSMFV